MQAPGACWLCLHYYFIVVLYHVVPALWTVLNAHRVISHTQTKLLSEEVRNFGLTYVVGFVQGDKEKALGLSVSPLMDRAHKGGITRSQVPLPSCVTISKTSSLAYRAHLLTISTQTLLDACCASEIPSADLAVTAGFQCHFAPVVQVGFSNIVGLPLFKAMADVFEDSAPLYEGALANFQAWEAAAAEDALQRTGSAASRSDAGSQA